VQRSLCLATCDYFCFGFTLLKISLTNLRISFWLSVLGRWAVCCPISGYDTLENLLMIIFWIDKKQFSLVYIEKTNRQNKQGLFA